MSGTVSLLYGILCTDSYTFSSDMKELENEVRAIKKDGLLWGAGKSHDNMLTIVVNTGHRHL